MERVCKPDKQLLDKYLWFTEWTPQSLKEARILLKLRQKDIANLMGVTPPAISSIERGASCSPWTIQMYGIILERYFAISRGYIPAFRKLGKNEYMAKDKELPNYIQSTKAKSRNKEDIIK